MSKIVSLKKLSKKDVIREKATALFRLKGYRATSMRHLAEDVGVEAASLYNHIENKAALLREICFGVAEAFNKQINEAEINGESQVDKVSSVIRFHVHMMMERFEEVYVSTHDWKHLEEPTLGEFLQQRRAYEKQFMTIIEKGIAANEFRKVNPYAAVLTILSAVRGIEFWHRSKKNTTAVEFENDLVSILIEGLKK